MAVLTDEQVDAALARTQRMETGRRRPAAVAHRDVGDLKAQFLGQLAGQRVAFGFAGQSPTPVASIQVGKARG
jgi:hypothetical protein